jgi:PAS domain S-box-containing protein
MIYGGGEMGALTREHDWGATPLGLSANWPQSLKSTVSLILGSPLPMIALWGPELVQLYNDGYARICGARHPKALGQRTRDCWPEVWAFNAPIYEAVQRGEVRSFARQELSLVRYGAPKIGWFDLTYSPLWDENEVITGVLVTVVESTGQVLAERRLAAEVKRQRLQFQRAPGFVCILGGPEHVFEFANDSYERLVGRTDLIGRSVREALPDIREQGFFELLDGVYATGKRHVAVDVAVSIAPGSGITPRTQYIDFTYEPIADDAGQVIGIFAQGHDVTDAHLAWEALRRSEANLRDLNAELERQVTARSRELERTWLVSPDLQGVANIEGFFENVNPAWTAMLGWSREEVLKTRLFEFIHPDDRERSLAAFDALRDGQPLLRFENRYLCKNGETRWLSWYVIPHGLKYYCSGRDITEDKTRAAELLKVAEHLRQSQKMEAVGQLTGGIAHDFNNMLAGVIGGLDIIKRRMAAGRYEDVGRFVALARESGERAASLTRRLLAFSRQQSLVFETLDVNALAQGMEEMLRRTLSADISLVLNLRDDVWLVKADASQLENALLNLAINARDAMPGGGTLTITTQAIPSDALDRPKVLELTPGEFVQIAVSDTGSGMTEAVLDHAFDPFFTTKPIGQGTGLGLSMIYGFVKQSHGHVAIESKIGSGTTVSVWLPRAVGVVEAAEPEVALERLLPATRMTVMVVEDEPVVRLLVTVLLEELGYDFMEATNSDDALPILRSTQRIDLLVTDVGLPGMNGRQLAEMARATRPGLKVLFVTGYAETAAVRGEFLADGMDMLEKPFAIDALGEKIRKMLGET